MFVRLVRFLKSDLDGLLLGLQIDRRGDRFIPDSNQPDHDRPNRNILNLGNPTLVGYSRLLGG